MWRFLILGATISLFSACNEIDLKQSCKGEWSYMPNDTTYCELLINDTIVLPYHNGKPNGQSYRYKIEDGKFYLYANEKGTVEASPIKYFDQDSFQILGITPSTLKRVVHKDVANESLARYYYLVDKITRKKTIVQLVNEKAFAQMNDYIKGFEQEFIERRELAIYKKKDKKLVQG